MRPPAKLAALAAICTLLALAPAAAQAPVDLRLAVVIGNGAYPPPGSLRNPVNDAKAMAGALRRLGFDVVELTDAGRADMAAALQRMRDTLAGKRGVALVYYAGHGLQHDWRNFMVPVDARVRQLDDIPRHAVDVSDVLDHFKAAGSRLNILVLDACRDNPFDNSLATKGLAPLDAPPGTFMAFATTPGNVAEDGDDGDNGLYTRFLLQELARPASRLEDVFKRVKLNVRRHSQGRQVPVESSNVDEDFSFDRGFARAETNNERRLERFRAEKVEWDRVRASASAGDFFAFLEKYPNGFMSEIAQFNAERLQKTTLVAQQRPGQAKVLAGGTNRFATGDEYTLLYTDRMTGLTRREPQRVTFADDNRVEVNGGQSVFDQMGGVIQDDSGLKDPPILMVPADIALGKRWRSVFQNRYLQYTVSTVVDFKTIAFEEIDLGGQRVGAFRVQMEGFAANYFQVKGDIWIEPSTMRVVRWDRTVRFSGGIVDNTSILVTGYRPAPR